MRRLRRRLLVAWERWKRGGERPADWQHVSHEGVKAALRRAKAEERRIYGPPLGTAGTLLHFERRHWTRGWGEREVA